MLTNILQVRKTKVLVMAQSDTGSILVDIATLGFNLKAQEATSLLPYHKPVRQCQYWIKRLLL